MYEMGSGGMESRLVEYLIAITWVDDVRYFGTENMVKEYEIPFVFRTK